MDGDGRWDRKQGDQIGGGYRHSGRDDRDLHQGGDYLTIWIEERRETARH